MANTRQLGNEFNSPSQARLYHVARRDESLEHYPIRDRAARPASWSEIARQPLFKNRFLTNSQGIQWGT